MVLHVQERLAHLFECELLRLTKLIAEPKLSHLWISNIQIDRWIQSLELDHLLKGVLGTNSVHSDKVDVLVFACQSILDLFRRLPIPN